MASIVRAVISAKKKRNIRDMVTTNEDKDWKRIKTDYDDQFPYYPAQQEQQAQGYDNGSQGFNIFLPNHPSEMMYSDDSDSVLVASPDEDIKYTFENIQELLAYDKNFDIKNEISQMSYKRSEIARSRSIATTEGSFGANSLLSEAEAYGRFKSLILKLKLDHYQSTELLKELKSLFPANNIPPKIHSDSEENIGSDVLWFDCCQCENFIYAGNNSILFSCKLCKALRYRPCRSCGAKTHCNHKKQYRTAIAEPISYRPLIGIFSNLLASDQFIKAISYKSYPSYVYENEDLYVDIVSGRNAKVSMQEMQENYNLFMQQQQFNQCFVPINLLLSVNFDGAQIYKTKVTNFTPLIVTLENLPPPLRNSVGIGMFTISLFTKSTKSSCYKFILHDCFVQELKLLEQGVKMTISGRMYYVQARLILHRYDTKALESVCKIQGTGSYAGCQKCAQVPG